MTPRLPMLDKRATRLRDGLVKLGADHACATDAVANFDKDRTALLSYARLLQLGINATRLWRLMQEHGYIPKATPAPRAHVDPRVERDMAASLVRLALIDLNNVTPADKWSKIALTVATSNLRRAVGEKPVAETDGERRTA